MSKTASPACDAQSGEVVSSASVTRAVLEQLVKPFPSGAFFLGEHLPSRVVDDNRQMRRLLVRFARLSEVQQMAQDPLPWTAYSWGRVFCEEGELRWDGSEGELRVVYLGQAHLLAEHLRASSRPVEGLKRRSTQYYLFGERPRRVKPQEVGVAPEEEPRLFLTTRIPRPLFYPVELLSTTKRVTLKIYCYCDPADGATVYFRFAGLELEAEPVPTKTRGGRS
ncbi:CRISPR-associated protein Csx19 [Thermogemmatispora carboxidivorans]|uniref:type III-D CRISPR-associated protein Csx19 n=1 Tax=Thermogemmatispora carboxidivorans TaxID=1382306 RepID=UPI00069BD37D|nr:CRISPR-associated protein Csx19 [Thermogemmatispora carboxidivorans]